MSGGGSCEMTSPFGTVVSYFCSILPTASPLPASVACASARLCPTTFGVLTSPPPLPLKKWVAASSVTRNTPSVASARRVYAAPRPRRASGGWRISTVVAGGGGDGGSLGGGGGAPAGPPAGA